ncbi:MAG TPA: Ig-like domain-containing protein [Candidatus Acidoferrum sp.]|jgi:hypothetical protein|nr:Ig-like domain-containing protein [Candidatus Acidoferrum sp.]
MLSLRAFDWVRRAAHVGFIAGAFANLALPSLSIGATVTLAWDPSTDPTVVGYNVYSGTSSRVYTASAPAGTNTLITLSNLSVGATYYFAATTYNLAGLESDYSLEASYAVPTGTSNAPPTLAPLSNVTVQENSGPQTINLTGISSGSTNTALTLIVSASSSSPGVIPNPTVNYTSPNTTGTLTFTPVAYASGSAVITVTVNNGAPSNNVVSQTFTVTVNAVNQPPTLNPLSNLTLNENAPAQTVNLSGIGTGAPNEVQTLTVTATSSNPGLVPNPAVGYASPNATGTLTFTPVAYASGSAVITVTVNDGAASNNIVTQTFTVTVNPVNQPPTLNPISNLTLTENAPAQTVNLSGIGTGAPNEVQTLIVTATSSNPGLIPNPAVTYASPSATGTLTLTPIPNTSGSTVITVTVNDGGASNNIVTRTFTATVNGVNQPPTLNPLPNLTLNENAPAQTVNLSGIGTGAPNEIQTLTVTATSSNPGLVPNPAVGYTSPSATGTLTFTPVANASGSTVITVTVNDGGASNNIVSQTFTVTVNPVNQPPTLNPLSNLTLNENAPAQTVNLSGIGTGAPNEVQTLTVSTTSSNPGLVPNPAVGYTSPSATGTLTFTPVANASGSTVIKVTINDGGASNNIVSQTFTVTVNPVNQPPTLNPLSNLTLNENAPAQTVNLSGIGSGAPNEVQTLTVAATSFNPGLIPNPVVVYTSPNATGTLTFTPVANASGSSVITVTVNDGGASNNIVSRTFTVTVNPVNQPPTLNPLPNLTLNENAPAQTVNLSGIGTGAPNEVQTLTVTATSGNPSLVPNPAVGYTSPNATGTLTFTPVAGASGSTVIIVTVNDGGASNNIVSQAFTVTVNPINQPPTLNPLSNLTLSENAPAQTVNLSGIGTGSPNEVQTLTVISVSSNPGLIPNPAVAYISPNATGTLTFTPVANASGSAVITVTVNDGGASNNIVSRAFTVTVTAPSQPPTLDPISDLTISENSGPQTVNLTGISSGSTNGAQTLSVNAFSSNTNLIANPTASYTSPDTNGSLTFEPATNSFGSVIITVMVDNGATSSNSLIRSFTVTVVPVNNPPTLDPVSNLTVNENSGPQTVNLTGISSGETNVSQTLVVRAVSGNPGVVPNPVVNYTSPNPTGSLTLTPAANASGAATITVTVDDGQPTNNLITRAFTVTVNQVVTPPTTNPAPSASWTLYWQHSAGYVGTWSLSGTNLVSNSLLQPATVGTTWKMMAATDLNGDGQDDLFFEDTSGNLAAWFMNGTNCALAAYLNPPQVVPEWQVVASGDLAGTGQKAMLLEHTDGWVAAWFMNGTNATLLSMLNPPRVDPAWRMAGLADLNGDGQRQILLQNTDGSLGMWSMANTNVVQFSYLNPPKFDPNWKIVGTQDLNGDGRTDIILQHKDGWVGAWMMNGTNIGQFYYLNPPKVDPAWRISGPR